jgi:hypothetical protein
MKRTGTVSALLLLLGSLAVGPVHAGGGPLGIDHVLSYDNSGIWKRSNQQALIYFAHMRESPIILGVLPHGFMVGVQKQC